MKLSSYWKNIAIPYWKTIAIPYWKTIAIPRIILPDEIELILEDYCNTILEDYCNTKDNIIWWNWAHIGRLFQYQGRCYVAYFSGLSISILGFDPRMILREKRKSMSYLHKYQGNITSPISLAHWFNQTLDIVHTPEREREQW